MKKYKASDLEREWIEDLSFIISFNQKKTLIKWIKDNSQDARVGHFVSAEELIKFIESL